MKARGTILERFSLGVSILCVVAILLCSSAVVLHAQQITGRILGSVLDSSGAAVPNAQITITNQETSAVRTVVSGADGTYNAPEIPAGTYTVEVTAQGFSSTQVKDVVVTVATDSRIDLKIQVGSVSQTVTVSESVPVVDTTSSAVGGTVDEQRVADLPLNGRNWTDLTLLQAGITQAHFAQTVGLAPGIVGEQGTVYSSNGATIRSNYYSLDGADQESFMNNNNSSVTNTSLGVDGIKEFKVLTSAFSAEYGMRAGSFTTIVSKSGTNRFHGDIFEYLRNSSLDARNFFDALDTQNDNGFGSNKSLPYPGKRIPPFRRSNFGGAFGGPIKKDKTFFYGVYEGIRQALGSTIADTTLPAACFSGGTIPAVIANNGCVSGSAAAPITVNPIILPFARAYSQPNLVGYTFNYTFPFIQTTSENYGQMRIDHTISASDTFFARYTQDESSQVSPGTFHGWTVPVYSDLFFITFGEDHIFTPTLLNSFRFSYSRTYLLQWYNENQSFIKVPIASLQLVPTDFLFINPSVPATSTVSPGAGVTALGCCGNDPDFGAQDIFTWSDDVYWTKGKHALKFGTLINHFQTYVNSHFGAEGSVNFASLSGFFTGAYSGSGSSSGVVYESGNSSRAWRYNSFGWYAQDDYRVTRRITLNLGFRYEVPTIPKERNPSLAYVVRNPLTDAAPTASWLIANTFQHDFSPRLGFAWDVTGRGTTAVRGGAGIYYDIANWGTGFFLQNSESGPGGSGTNSNSIPNALATPIVPLMDPITKMFAADPIIQKYPYSRVYVRQGNYYNHQPTMAEYNLNVEQQLPWAMGLQVGYFGSRGWHQYQAREGDPTAAVGTTATGLPIYGCWNIAEIPTAFVLPNSSGACPSAFTSPGPKINPNWEGVFQNSGTGDLYYNSLQVQLLKRISQGLQFQFAYTYSENIGDGVYATLADGAASGQGNQLSNGYSERSERGPTGFAARHNLRVNMIYHAPSIPREGIIGKILNGWWFSSIISAQSGYQFSPTFAAAADRDLQNNASVLERPSIDPSFNKNTVITSTVSQWFNPTMFDLEPAGRLGNAGVGILSGPGLINVDGSFVKDTKAGFLGEAGVVEFRGELFNSMNHPNFSLPTTTVWSSSSPATVPTGQIGVTPGVTAFATAGKITSTINASRQIQFALKFIF